MMRHAKTEYSFVTIGIDEILEKLPKKAGAVLVDHP